MKCRLTSRTGLVKDATAEELLMANTKNFVSYPWTEPDRVAPTLLKSHVMEMAKKSQRLSGILRQSQPLASRLAE